ncbi:RES family NAD+ phosphorylase [Salipiger mangrovisoli]|uniref:RES family NAD+ phosphorylase n=1 Tax=Salipiger mangrovisoli TaxID=2865933 RepID=A0ABR9X785_9RHOB|nr:RES family NAD+ phosphorylase [Salipiger mangrovisoli]MBE9639460.1 RES family NAD+ phosphorylase [Salipiger mangrovisoli]
MDRRNMVHSGDGGLPTEGRFRMIAGRFYRIVPTARRDQALSPALSPEGRFHHSGQPTLYVSSRPDWAEHAIQAYVKEGDPPRIICELEVAGARVLDLRDAAQCADWRAEPALAAVPWLPERAAGNAASTWRVSDLARQGGADGMIYTARSAPSRWHLVLFDWLSPRVGARLTGRTLPYPLRAD